MRIVGFVALAALAIVVLVLGIPVLVRPVIVDAVRAASPFGAAPLTVAVDVSALGLVHGRVNSIRVYGTDLQRDLTVVGSLDLTAHDVATGGAHGFDAIAGAMENVTLVTGTGATVAIERIELSGPSEEMQAVASLDAVAGVALVRDALADSGLDLENVSFGEGVVRLTVLGAGVEVPLGVEDGALVLPDMLGTGSVVIVAPEPGDPWRLTGVSVSETGLTINAVVDANGVLTPA